MHGRLLIEAQVQREERGERVEDRANQRAQVRQRVLIQVKFSQGLGERQVLQKVLARKLIQIVVF